jgi:23S rRNA U2552 (ribose-2'-O)-methylase RlmE/FtsJ
MAELCATGPGGPSITPLLPYTGAPLPHTPVICTPEWHMLQQAKNEINCCYQEGKWDDYKKVTNQFEYVFLSWNRRSSRSVATRQPLSRSYFKLIELWKSLDLTTRLAPLSTGAGLVTAHSAEGPGGFIEACTVMAEKNRWGFKSATAITLRSDAKKVPGWRKAAHFLAAYPQIAIHDGADGTGNILLRANQDAYVDAVLTAHPSGAHLYTADGGFDFSNDYNAQEDAIFPLLVAEALLGLRTLAKGGCLSLKCFDTTEQPTLELLWIVSRAFCEWRIVKPRTSRTGNSERYLVGLGFLGRDEAADAIAVLSAWTTSGARLLCESPDWKTMMTAVASLQERIEHNESAVIRETLALIENTNPVTIRSLVLANVQRSIAWCREHGEDVAICWQDDLERNLEKETTDLLQILKSEPYGTSYTTWGNRLSTPLDFSSFRAGSNSSTS